MDEAAVQQFDSLSTCNLWESARIENSKRLCECSKKFYVLATEVAV